VQVYEADVRSDEAAGGAGVHDGEPEGGRHGLLQPAGGVLLATDCAGSAFPGVQKSENVRCCTYALNLALSLGISQKALTV
jgi:hypothetical protein